MNKKIIAIYLFLMILIFNACTKQAAITKREFIPTETVVPPVDITICQEGCDFTSLQEALDAESTKAGMVLSLEDAVHTEAGVVISKDIVIQGKGQSETIIQAAEEADAAIDRVFLVSQGSQVAIRHLSIRYGNPQGDVRSGGAIRKEGDLILENVVIRENQASAGGVILNDGTLSILNSIISDNIAKGGGDYYTECKTGGGMKIMSGTVTIENTTISKNQSKGKGGGIHIACLGELYITNSTISGNLSYEDGGGIFINGMAVLTNTTITENEATNGGGISLEGSGEKDAPRGQLNYQNNIIVNNYARLEKYGAADCLAGRHTEIVMNKHNWVGDGNCAAEYSGELSLEPLAENGGFTSTHLLNRDSPAADLLPADECFSDYDQRGFPRIAPCDLGAVESF